MLGESDLLHALVIIDDVRIAIAMICGMLTGQIVVAQETTLEVMFFYTWNISAMWLLDIVTGARAYSYLAMYGRALFFSLALVFVSSLNSNDSELMQNR